MIFDADTHITPFQEYAVSCNAERMLEHMDTAGVDKALCWAHRPYSRNQLGEVLEYLYKATKDSDRLVGYGWIDPMLGADTAMEMLKRCLTEYGFPGVKFNGCQNEHFNDDEQKVMPLLEEIAKAGTSVAFHTGGDAPDQTNPYRVGKIAKRFPEMKILMVHIGCGGASYDLSRAAIEVAKECSNITLVGSDIRTNSLLNAMKELGPERICFGSDTPFENMAVEVARYKTMFREKLTEDEMDCVMGRNLMKFLGCQN